MITHQTSTDRAAEWLASYLAQQPGRTADSATVHAAGAELGLDRNALRRGRNRLGVKVHSGSLPGRPFVTWWILPERQPLILIDSERAEAERFAGVVADGDAAKVFEALEALQPTRLALALAVLLSESRAER